ncbi:MAG: chemotaxis sensory transducer [uncultured bacterium]|nr:MAG: chemotaxis sensory transducer [uncultured bacterium]
MSIADKSRATLKDLGDELLSLTQTARQHSDHITAVTEQMHNLTQEGVMAMQFEDIVTQMMSRISQRTLNVGEYMHAFLSLHNDQGQTNGLQRFRQRSELLVQLLVNSHVKADALRTHTHGATKSAEGDNDGDIELF